MTALEAYQKFLLKINKNDTSTNLKVPKSKFVLIFNEQQRKWFFDQAENKRSSSKKDNIESLLVIDEELVKVEDRDNTSTFKLPLNAGKFESSFSIAKRGECIAKLTNWDVKPRNLPILLQDDNNDPSFDYRETVSVYNAGNITIYRADFAVEKVFLTYYRFPINIDIEGYVRIDGDASTTIDPELDDIYVDQIIDKCDVEVTRNYNDAAHFQLSQTRIAEQQ